MYKVFLAEDEIVVREGIRNTIPWETTSYTLVGEAPDGEIALSMIQEIKPDILITDIKMPFIDGLTLSRIVKKTLPWIKIIILSGHDEFEYARDAISVGVEEYLLKPISAKDMIQVLDTVAARIDREKEDLLSIERLKQQVQSHAEMLRETLEFKPRTGPGAAADAGPSLKRNIAGLFDETGLLAVNGNSLWTKFQYGSRKDIDSIIGECTALLGGNPDDDHILEYFILGELIVIAAKVVEEMGGNVKEVIPFCLGRQAINEIIHSREVFYDTVRALFNAVIEFRDSHIDGRYRSVILKAREYIDQNFGDPEISLHSTASYVGISPNHLSTVFSQEMGETFVEYLTRIRIGRAKELLENTAMKSAGIACETGFSDPHYFSFIFKKNTGLSPREYRVSRRPLPPPSFP
ncbi:MAG: response regulator [Spirochaetaceae bacterium]|jgi:two-component system response regulator YesN|nr:response regulator [Spirochaetaceae bacterium]